MFNVWNSLLIKIKRIIKIMKIKKFTNLLLVFSLLFSVFGNGFDTVSKAELNKEISKINYESKVFCNATIEQDFSDDTVLVVLDKNISQINKVHDISFFGDIK
jgi:hypothetical protein